MLTPKFWIHLRREGFVKTWTRGHKASRHSHYIAGNRTDGYAKCVGEDDFGNRYYEDFDVDRNLILIFSHHYFFLYTYNVNLLVRLFISIIQYYCWITFNKFQSFCFTNALNKSLNNNILKYLDKNQRRWVEYSDYFM